MQSDFNNGTGALKKKVPPGNFSQQNTNPFGVTDRGFKGTKLPANATNGKPPMSNYSGGHGLSQAQNYGGINGGMMQVNKRPPMQRNSTLQEIGHNIAMANNRSRPSSNSAQG